MVLKNIPFGINKRLSEISCNQEEFEKSAPVYQNELDKNGYNHKLEFQTPATKPKPRRRKSNLWFNPPFSQDVQTNVAKEFLKLVDIHFPRGSLLYPLFNRSTLKVSYRCLPNMAAVISKHNSKTLKNSNTTPDEPPPTCNCQPSRKVDCPFPGKCNQFNVIYQATVKTKDLKEETYIGLAGSFKERERNHRNSFKYPEKRKKTKLSKYYWKSKEENSEPKVSWKILEKCHTYNPITDTCQLCIREKYHIIHKSDMATLNKRSEIFSFCRHKSDKLLVPQDLDEEP